MPPTDEIGWLSEEDHDPLLEESTPVAKLFPKEVDFFRRYWIDLASDEGYYIRSAYFSRIGEGGYMICKWRPAKHPNSRNGRWYFSRFDEAARKREIEKHLNWPGYIARKRKTFKNTPEPAYWLGTLAGPQTLSDAIDLDSHTIVGFYSVPIQGTRRELPVPKCDLEFFQTMKRLHDAFPDRTWMTTSANLGKALWKLHQRPLETRSAHRKLQSGLIAIGLELEIYPVPPSSGFSLGKCHRRPFGFDSALHTEDGIIVTPIRQIQHMMERDTTISWPTLFQQHVQRMTEIYEFWENNETEPTNFAKEAIDEPYLDRPKSDILSELRTDIAKAQDWFERGCPCSTTKVNMISYVERDKSEELADQEPPIEEGKIVEYRGQPHVVLPRGYRHLTMHQLQIVIEIIEPSGVHKWLLRVSDWNRTESSEPVAAIPLPASKQATQPRNVLKPRKKSKAELEWEAFEQGRSLKPDEEEPWSKEKASTSQFWTYLKEIAQKGVPEPDKLFGFLRELAASLYWREYFDLPEIERDERVVEDLRFWVANKHNGRVSRLSSKAGKADIDREIRNAVRAVQECGPGIKYYYAQMRQNDKRYPHCVQRLSLLIRQEEEIHTPLVHCKRRVLIDDDAQLPAHVQKIVEEIIHDHPRLIYKGKCTFRDFARRFLSTIWQNKGNVHLSWQILNAMRGSPEAKDRKQVLYYKHLLAAAGLIYDDWENYALRGIASCRYRLTEKTKQAFEQDFQQANKADEA